MLEHILTVGERTLGYAQALVSDIDEEAMCRQPAGLVNHPAWELGHIALVSQFASALLGVAPTLPEAWMPLFTIGSQPTDDRAAYPSTAELLAAVESRQALLTDAMRNADPSAFEAPTPDEKLRAIFPTVGDLVTSAMTSHIAVHLGQLSAWRKAMGLPSALGV